MMMNTIQTKKIDMADLERVNGGGWFDNIVDFCVDAIEDASNFVPDELVAVELVVDEGVKRFSESVYDALEEVSHQMPK